MLPLLSLSSLSLLLHCAAATYAKDSDSCLSSLSLLSLSLLSLFSRSLLSLFSLTLLSLSSLSQGR
jgi:hypothetical protein